MRRLLPALCVLLLAACAGTQKKSDPPSAAAGAASGPGVAGSAVPPDCSNFKPYPKALEDPSTRGHYVSGGLYRPGVKDTTPDYVPNVACIPEPTVALEPRSAYGNRSPYTVLGKSYRVLDSTDGFVESGLASYYGNKFHGRKTSNHEVYDMYAFTAAHKSLPLPSYARVTNLDNGRSVVVRVNDRGPFHEGRVIDLSYAAAVKLDIHRRGTGRVEVRALRPGEDRPARVAASVDVPPAPAQAPASAMDGLVGNLPRATPASAGGLALAATGAQAAGVPPEASTAVPAQPNPPPASGPPPAASGSAGAVAPPRGLADHPDYGREEDRFRLVDENGRVKSADEFDAWLRARQARIDAARALAAAAGPAAATVAPPPPAPVRVASTPAPAAPTAVAAPVAPASAPAPRGGEGEVVLQVGVFSVRSNAERALATLLGAGIAAARIQDVAGAHRTLWRVRVGPVDAASVAELTSRVSGLGLGMPQLVRE